jgi:hypothetical protein
MEQETKLLQKAIKALEALQNVAVYKNKEIELNIHWGQLEQVVNMLKMTEENACNTKSLKLTGFTKQR